MATATTTTECTECWASTTLDTDLGVAVVAVPSNGRRGSLHVAAHVVSVPLYGDADVPMWDCICGHAESLDTTL